MPAQEVCALRNHKARGVVFSQSAQENKVSLLGECWWWQNPPRIAGAEEVDPRRGGGSARRV